MGDNSGEARRAPRELKAGDSGDNTDSSVVVAGGDGMGAGPLASNNKLFRAFNGPGSRAMVSSHGERFATLFVSMSICAECAQTLSRPTRRA